jgi:hypothetical protein
MTVATTALAVRRSIHSARFHPQSARSYPQLGKISSCKYGSIAEAHIKGSNIFSQWLQNQTTCVSKRSLKNGGTLDFPLHVFFLVINGNLNSVFPSIYVLFLGEKLGFLTLDFRLYVLFLVESRLVGG